MSRHDTPKLLMTCALLLMTLTASLEAQAGPWTKKRGEHYIKLSELYFQSDTFVAPDGERIEGTDYLALSSALYFELGLSERAHVQGFLPFVFSRNHFEERGARYATVGLGDALLAVQTTPFDIGQLPWALRLEGKLPLYDVGAIRGSEAMSFPALGDGQVDLTLWASVGASLWPRPIYFLAEVGWRHRTAWYYGTGNDLEFGDGVAARAQGGYIFEDRLLLAANMNAVYSPIDDQITQSFLTLGPMLGVELGRGFWLEATCDLMPWSKNNAPGTTWSLGLSHRAP